jgi:hypothetical protein
MELPPKEKADELATNMFNVQSKSPCSWSEAIQCAQIAVDEILKELIELHDKFDIGISYKIEYWQEVKTELENYDKRTY